MTSLVIDIAGGTGSGKTTLAQAVLQRVGVEDVTYIQQDTYYVDRSSISPKDRKKSIAIT